MGQFLFGLIGGCFQIHFPNENATTPDITMIDKIAFSSPNKTSRSHLQKRSKPSRQNVLVKMPIYRDLHLLNWHASFRWSSQYCHLWNSNEMTNGKTHSTLQKMVIFVAKALESNIFSILRSFECFFFNFCFSEFLKGSQTFLNRLKANVKDECKYALWKHLKKYFKWISRNNLLVAIFQLNSICFFFIFIQYWRYNYVWKCLGKCWYDC